MVEQDARETEASEYLLSLVREDLSTAHEREFMCECGEVDCREFVLLTVAAFVARRDRGEGVFAAGHHASAPGRTLA